MLFMNVIISSLLIFHLLVKIELPQVLKERSVIFLAIPLMMDTIPLRITLDIFLMQQQRHTKVLALAVQESARLVNQIHMLTM